MSPLPDPPILTRKGVALGARMVLPMLPGAAVFAAAYGAASSAKGLGLVEATAMSFFVYAGMSQMVALEAWPREWSWSVVVSLGLLAMVVNSRMVLQGASLYPWLRVHSNGVNAAHLSLLTDANWLIGSRYHAEGGRDVGVLLGAGLTMLIGRTIFTVPGHMAGALVNDPKRFGLDLVMPIFFAAMLVPLWRGRRAAVPWVVAGIVGLAVSKLLPGHLFIMAGALSGMACAALIPEKAS
jgi:predicted branched-subunit amino acid permease